jgi:hypothetical protein
MWIWSSVFEKNELDNPLRHILMNLLKVWDLVAFSALTSKISIADLNFLEKKRFLKLCRLSQKGAMITTEILAKAKKQFKNHAS